MSIFKYDVVTLINLVKSKPCLWDKTHENYKRKILRDKSWEEIFEFLENDYDQLSEDEKKKTGGIIKAKWCNLKDAFLRSLRKGESYRIKKTYTYSKHLQFLLKPHGESNFNQAGIQDNNIEFEGFEESQLSTSYSQCSVEPKLEMLPVPSISRSNSAEDLPNSKRRLDDEKVEILYELKREKRFNGQCVGNIPYSYHSLTDQELLLLSFLPYLRDMDETELMEFQMEVLSTLRRIKEKRV